MRIIKSGSSDPPSLPYWNSPFTDHPPCTLSLTLGSDDPFHQESLHVQGSSTSSKKSTILHTVSSRFHSHFHYYLLFKSHQKWVCFLSVPLTKMKEVLGEFSLMVSRLLLHSLVSPLFILLQSASIVSWYQKLLLRYWLPSNMRLVCDSCNFPATLDGKAKLLFCDIGRPLPEYTTNKKWIDSFQSPRLFCIISIYEDWHPILVKWYYFLDNWVDRQKHRFWRFCNWTVLVLMVFGTIFLIWALFSWLIIFSHC